MKNKIDDGGSAYPLVTGSDVLSQGMSIRDYFAGQVLSGLMSATNENGIWTADDSEDEVSEIAYRVADSMLKVRNK